MRKFFLRVITDKNLGDPDFVANFLNAWFDYHPDFAPDRYSHGEPIRKLISPTNLNEVIVEWQKPPALMFKRVAHPKWIADLSWRKDKGLDSRPYPWGIKVWLDYENGKKWVHEFFNFLIDWFEPVFGYVTDICDETRKHNGAIPQYKDGRYAGMVRGCWGADIGDTLPGIYWLTYISSALIPDSVLKEVDEFIVRDNGLTGRLFQLYEDPDIIGSDAASTIENGVMDLLGKFRFFDLENFLEINNGQRF